MRMRGSRSDQSRGARGSGAARKAKAGFTSVDAYLAAQPEDVRPILQRVRAVIRKALPDAEEVISYQIPAYKLHGATVIFFAGWKQHYSLYPATAAAVAAFKDELAGYKLSKGTIRFPLSQPVRAKLIADIAKLRAKEAAARAQAKAVSRNAEPAARTNPRRKSG
jgi:uncharacterized protein YdhG (YjbR/CyaY superfamily)